MPGIILEDGARTVSDFKEVIREWDHLDDNRERKERYHEIGRENIDSKKDVAPLEMHNSLSDEDYSKIIYDFKLSVELKVILL